MKRIIVLIVFAICASMLFASVLGGNLENVKVASTAHFDIIYKDPCSETASVIFDNCEDIYSSLVSFFGVDPDIHIPVVVTSVYKELNAYYTIYPANRIVMYDTVSTQGDLSNFKSTILGVFRHELTHAFHYNIRGPFFQGMSVVFGDIVSLSPIFYLYPSMTEGGAVLSESVDGYGRLNSSYSMQIVRQAKLEGLFPNWFEVAGARDTYPSGLLYYNFAAAFLGYLAQTYGLETITSIYEDFAHIRWWSTPGQVIKSRIGKSVKEAWKDFYEWVDVPENVKQAEIVESRAQSARYGTPTVAPDGSVYVYDYSTWDVLRFSSDLSCCDSILTFPTAEASVSVSDDSKLLLLPIVSEGSTCVRLYDISGKKASLVHTFSSSDMNLRDGTFVTYDDSPCVLLYGNEGKDTYLELYSLSTMALIEGKSMHLGFDVTAFGFNDLKDGRVAFVTTSESRDNIAVLDLSDMALSLVDNPDEIKIYSLASSNAADGVLCFSWYPGSSEATNTGRYGEISIAGDEVSMRLSGSDVMGSVNNPARLGQTVVFSTRFFERLDLRTIPVSELDLSEPINLAYCKPAEKSGPSTDALESASGKYWPIRYFGDGVLIPYATAEFGSVTTGGMGLTWITSDPTETFTHSVSAGYGIGSGNLLGSYTFTYNGKLQYSLFMNIAYGFGGNGNEEELSVPEGCTLFQGGSSASFAFELGHPYRTLSVADTFALTLLLTPYENASALSNHLELVFQNTRKTGMGIYQRYAFFAAAYMDQLLPGVQAGFSVPALLWWRCDGPNITNLPFTFIADAHFADDYDDISLTGQAKVVLYGREIQRAIQFLGLHVQRFTLDATYVANYLTKEQSFIHQAELCAKFTFSPIVGAYLTRLKTELGATLIWNSQLDDFKVKVYFNLGS